MALRLSALISQNQLGSYSMVLVLGGLMIGVGLAFKLSALPFHFWCPDVFEGATAEVNAFLSRRLESGRLGTVGARGRWVHHDSCPGSGPAFAGWRGRRHRPASSFGRVDKKPGDQAGQLRRRRQPGRAERLAGAGA